MTRRSPLPPAARDQAFGGHPRHQRTAFRRSIAPGSSEALGRERVLDSLVEVSRFTALVQDALRTRCYHHRQVAELGGREGQDLTIALGQRVYPVRERGTAVTEQPGSYVGVGGRHTVGVPELRPDLIETAAHFDVELSPVPDDSVVEMTEHEAVRQARDPIAPTQAVLVTMRRRWIPNDCRTAWWLIQDGVEWAHSTPAPRPGEVLEPPALARGQAIVAVDAATGEQLFSGVWGR
jgi:hypothetical protein